jgi:hypothetical protein
MLIHAGFSVAVIKVLMIFPSHCSGPLIISLPYLRLTLMIRPPEVYVGEGTARGIQTDMYSPRIIA